MYLFFFYFRKVNFKILFTRHFLQYIQHTKNFKQNKILKRRFSSCYSWYFNWHKIEGNKTLARQERRSARERGYK